MSSFEVYVLLTLDNINGAAFALTAAGLFVTVLGLALLLFSFIEDEPDSIPLARKILKWSIPMMLIGVLASTLIPTTKQAAVIIVAPMILNAETADTVSEEFKEVYDLAKSWLEDVVKDE